MNGREFPHNSGDYANTLGFLHSATSTHTHTHTHTYPHTPNRESRASYWTNTSLSYGPKTGVCVCVCVGDWTQFHSQQHHSILPGAESAPYSSTRSVLLSLLQSWGLVYKAFLRTDL